MTIRVLALPTATVQRVLATHKSPGYGHPAHTELATGHGPCRHCLKPFRIGEDHRTLFTCNPFHHLAEIPPPGPVFIHSTPCERYNEDAGYPTELLAYPAVMDAYDANQNLRPATQIKGSQPPRHPRRATLPQRSTLCISPRPRSRLLRLSRRKKRRGPMTLETPSPTSPEPWLRGTLTDLDPIRRQILHALELSAEDAALWLDPLTDAQLLARPANLAPIAFHLRHIARSLDRLLTYAEGNQLDPDQLAALKTELSEGTAASARTEFRTALAASAARIRAISPESFAEPRTVGRKQLPTTVGALLVHCADHTQRHTGQFVTTAKVVGATSKEGTPR